MKRRSRPSKAQISRQLKEATERQEAAQCKAAAAKLTESQYLQPMTWAEAQRTVEFIIDGKIKRHDIYQPLPIEYVDTSVKNDDLNSTNASEKAATPGKTSARKTNSTTSVKRATRPSKAASAKMRINVPEAHFEEINDPVKVSSHKIRLSGSAPYFKYQEKSNENLDEKVEYDLDDQDSLWLKSLNEIRRQEKIPQVSETAFEAIIDKFEKAAHFEALTSGRHNDTGVDEDAVCSICLDGDCLNANAILFCDMCNLAVHQECYGVPYIPEGQWLCRRCLESPSMPVSCCLCPNKGGAFKQTDDGRWAHVVCALWIPEVSFSNSVFLEPIEGIKNIPAARWRLKCYLCKRNGVGAAIQCHRQHCYSAFHVTCAIQAGLFMRIDPNPSSEDRIKRTAYCDTHTPPNSDATPMISHGISDGERSSSNSPNAMGRLMKKRQKIRQARKLLAQSQSVNKVVINVPTISEDSLQAIASQYNRLVGKSDLMRQILAYWKLKRKSRCGVPLIRRLHVSNSSGHGSSSDLLKENPGMIDDFDQNGGLIVAAAPNLQDLANSSDPEIREHFQQLRTFRLLRQNLERVRLLIELVHKRERMKRDIQKISLACLDYQLSPFQMVLRSLLGKLRSLDKKDLFELPVSARQVPNYYKVIKKPMCFSKMEEKLDDDDYRSLEEFEADFQLIIDNCMSYNLKTSSYYKAAVELQNTASPVFNDAHKYVDSCDFDFDSGMYKETMELALREKATKNQEFLNGSKMEVDEIKEEVKEEPRTRKSKVSIASPQRSPSNTSHCSDQKASTTNSSPIPVTRTRRVVKGVATPNSVEALLPPSIRDTMPLEDQIAILAESLEAAVRTSKNSLVRELRREISVLKKANGQNTDSDRCSSASTQHSPPKVNNSETDQGPVTRHRGFHTPSPNGLVKEHKRKRARNGSSPRSPTPSNGHLLMIASPNGKSSPQRANPVVSSTPVVTNGNSTSKSIQQTGRISTRRSAAQAGIHLPSVFGSSPPPYKHRRISSPKTNVHLISPSPSRHSSMNGGDSSVPNSPPTPGVNRRTAVLFKKRTPISNSVAASPQHNGSSKHDLLLPQRSHSAASLINGIHSNGGSSSPNGTLTVNNSIHQVNGTMNGQNHHDGKSLRRLSSSSAAEQFRSGSSLALQIQTDLSSMPTDKRRVSPRLVPGSPRSLSPAPRLELSDSEEELLADLRKRRLSGTSNTSKLSPTLSHTTVNDGQSGSATSVAEAEPIRRKSRRSSTNSNIGSNSKPLRTFDVVWVKPMVSHPAGSPGIIVDESLLNVNSDSNGTTSLLKKLLPSAFRHDNIPQKPQQSSAGDVHLLVSLFDARQTLRWISASKMEPLDATLSATEMHLPPLAQDAYRRACLLSNKLNGQVTV